MIQLLNRRLSNGLDIQEYLADTGKELEERLAKQIERLTR